MAKISTLVDAFTTQDFALWDWGPAGVTHGSGKAHFNASDYGSGYLTSWATYDLTNSAIVFKFDAVPSTANNDGPFFVMQMQDTSTDPYVGNRVAWYYDPTGAGTGNLKPRTITSGGTISDGTSLAWAGTPLYLRITDDGTNIVWASSTDGTAYTTRRTLARPGGFTLTSMYACLFGSNNAAETGSFDVDAVNPSVGPQTHAATAALGATAAGLASSTSTGDSNAMEFLIDEFATKDVGKWTWYGTADATGDSLVVPSTGWGAVANGIVSTGTRDFTASQLVFDLGVLGLPTPTPESILELGVSSAVPSGTERRLFFSIYHTTTTADLIEVRYRDGTPTDGLVTGTLPRQRFLRMRHTAPNFTMDTSADGTAWSAALTIPVATVFTAVTALRAWVLSKGSATGSYQVAAINPAVTAVVVPPSVPQTFAASTAVQSSVLTWTAPASNGGSAVTGYEVTWLPGGTTPVALGTVLTYTATGLTAGTPYTFSVKARNAAGLGAAAAATATPTAPAPTGVPGPPTSVTATAGNAAATLSWTAPGTTNGTITGYDVLDQASAVRGTVSGTGTSTTVSGLTNGMQYTFRVVAKNATGSSIPSAPSNTVTPVATSGTGALYTRSTLGAAATSYTALETAIGQALAPVVLYVRATDAPASIAAAVTAATDRNRRCLLMLSIAGWDADLLRMGSYDAQLTALGVALSGTGVAVFVAPMYEPNDWKMPWSPLYGATSPGYVATDNAGVGSADEYKLAFDRVARVIRGVAALVRLVWVASVEDQPTAPGDDWASFYPGAPSDVICLKGLNYGNGPAAGGGATVWQTASAIFDTAMTAAEALHATKPIWVFTGSHEPATVYSPVGPGFAAGASVPIDATHSKATWLTDLLSKTTWPRVTTVVLYSISDTRNWSLTSWAPSTAAITATIDSAWALTQVTQDALGDYVRDSTTKFAAWLRSGTTPATRANPYARPDKATAGGVRGSLVFGVPYSPGQKTLVNIPTADMLAWNRVHGEILRQCARNGMQGWAFASGSMAAADPVLMWDGTVTNSRTTLDAGRDSQPGPLMQVEGGLRAATGGTAPAATPAPDFTFPTTLSGTFTDPTTQISVDWTALTATQLTGYTLSGYQFGWATTDPRSTQATWDSAVLPVTTAPDPFVFTSLIPGATYTVYVEAVMTSGARGRTTKGKSTTPVTVSQTPSAPTAVAATNLTTTTLTINWAPPTSAGTSAVLGYYVSWGGWTSARTTEPTRFMDLTGFAADTTYTIDVWAENTQGMGAHLPLAVKTPAAGTGTINPALQGLPTTTRLAGAFCPNWAYGGGIPANSFSANWNLLFMFAGASNGDGSYRWPYALPTGLVAARAAGKRIILSLGGAGNVYNFLTRAASDRCVNSIIAMNQQFGGTTASPVIDGVDFNTFEAQALSNSPATQTAEYIYMGQQLHTIFGSNFIVHGPPAPWNNDDMNMCRQALAAGAFDLVSPQYYDGGLASYNTINGVGGSSIDGWVNNVAGGNAAKIGVGYGLDWFGDGPPNYMTREEIDRSWVDLEARFPALKAAWIWRSDFDTDSTGNSANGNYFANTTCPKIRSL